MSHLLSTSRGAIALVVTLGAAACGTDSGEPSPGAEGGFAGTLAGAGGAPQTGGNAGQGAEAGSSTGGTGGVPDGSAGESAAGGGADTIGGSPGAGGAGASNGGDSGSAGADIGGTGGLETGGASGEGGSAESQGGEANETFGEEFMAVAELLNTRCTECHRSGDQQTDLIDLTSDDPAGLYLRLTSMLETNLCWGELPIAAGDPESSVLFQVVNGPLEEPCTLPQMPAGCSDQGTCLTADELSLIETWIGNGASR